MDLRTPARGWEERDGQEALGRRPCPDHTHHRERGAEIFGHLEGQARDNHEGGADKP